MNPDMVTEFLKKGFHVTLGATTSVVESLQDSQKREENISQLNLGIDQLSQIWADKGEITESEARKMIDGVATQYGVNANPMSSGSSTSPSATSPSIDPSLQQELKTLTNQLANIRLELTQMDNQNDT
ncbi:hypothetical protein HRE53_20550 [Acaryochloris sp. 'Moss Beach']|uniref:hypothetical protein n=1 Tax=Acaryochloris TaxID=155977 RepID=UPI001BB0925C|nr:MULTISPECIES: hypothetical protein [Acaryochloris]QUY44072.1 hypothetical protein I1H34_08270 [Acaryochloris marina S15]UJB68818.1 hypothetical protein HRE53_20550 [Acaryochloris sp. 'Moss Beach']